MASIHKKTIFFWLASFDQQMSDSMSNCYTHRTAREITSLVSHHDIDTNTFGVPVAMKLSLTSGFVQRIASTPFQLYDAGLGASAVENGSKTHL